MKYIYAININKTTATGVIDVEQKPPQILCYCNESNSKIIIEALDLLSKTKAPKPKPKDYGMTVELSFEGYDLEVYGFFKKGEDAILFPIDAAYPGSSDKFVIERVNSDGKELDKHLPGGELIQWDALEEKVLEKIKD